VTRLAAVAVLLLVIAFGALAAETGESSSAGGAEHLAFWKLMNFLILAAVLGWAAYKFGGPFFSSRTAEIRRDIDEAARTRKQAEARFAEIEQRLKQFGAEVDRLREQARQESEAESGRVRQETERELKKIQAQAEEEIASAGKAARQQLRAYAAGLAVDLAAERLRQHVTPEADQKLLDSMVQGLENREAARVS
jgi:F-type H+-transporting ATPase subunit b